LVVAGCSFTPGGSMGTPIDGAIRDGAADAPGADGPSADGPGADAAVQARRKAIVLPGSKIKATMTSFPLWIDLTDPQLTARAQADGSDIYFTDAAGAVVPYERVSWDPGTNHLQAWVGAAQLTSGQAAKFYVVYGGATAPAAAPAQVFAAFAAVWHLDDALATTTIVDARGTAPGTATGLDATHHRAAGKLGAAIDFDGATSQIQFTNPLTGGGASTLSAWVNQLAPNGMDAILTIGTAQKNQSRFLYAVYGGNHVGFGLYQNDVPDTGNDVRNKGWTLLHWVIAADGNSTLYRDGKSIATKDFGNSANTTGAGGWIGFAPAGWGTNYLNGALDEVRLSTADLTPEWIGLEFATQGDPAGTYTIGAEELAP
jgi:hypothetical protein